MGQNQTSTCSDAIRLYLISGFLGAGKTTLLRALLKQFSAKKLGVLVNEFGSVGMDGLRLNHEGVNLVEINNGSVFCACLKDGFVRTLKAFSEQPIDILFIECSGMADPIGMNLLLEGLAPYLTRPFSYQGSICMVDCTTYLDYVEVMLPVQNQVIAADLILVNKTDLVDAQTLAEIHKSLKELNAEACLHNTIYAHLPPQALENDLRSHGKSQGSGSNTPASRPSTYLLSAGAACTREQLEAFHAEVAGPVLRMKGYLPGGAVWWDIDGVADRLEVRETPASPFAGGEAGTGRLVLISCGQEDISSSLAAAWKRHVAGELQVEAT